MHQGVSYFACTFAIGIRTNTRTNVIITKSLIQIETERDSSLPLFTYASVWPTVKDGRDHVTGGSTLLVEGPPLVVDVTARDDSRSQPVADQRHTLTLSASVTAYLWRTLQIILSVRDGSLK